MKTKDTINLPIAIPVWGLVLMIGTGVFTAGILYNQLATLIESSRKSEERITFISNNQIGDHASIGNIQLQVQSHEARLTNVERAVLEGRK